jgi:hypothetical protein
MGAEEPLASAAGKTIGHKVPILGISIGAAETAKQGWDAKNAFVRAANQNRTKQQRIAAIRAATIYGRRAILRAAGTVAAQIPGCGTLAALALDGANVLFSLADGDPKELEEASRNPATKRRSTEAFMRAMREQAAKQTFAGNSETQRLGNGNSKGAAC